MHNSILSRILE